MGAELMPGLTSPLEVTLRVDGVQPFYFGAPERRLFGVYSTPRTDSGQDSTVVLCNPCGQDYLYAFRPLRTLATRLERSGFHTLRFDYLGTGDSAGNLDQISPQQWVADVVAAVQEVRALLPNTLVSLVGFRLGATLAALAAAQCRDVERLVLWEPVIQGSDYAKSLYARHQEWFQDLVRSLPGARRLATDDELLGARVTESFRRDLERLSLWSLDARPARHVLIVNAHDNPESPRLAQRLQELGARVDVTHSEAGPRIATVIPGMQIGLVPSGVLGGIVSWFGSPVND